jgi:hypothetical protein
MPDQDDPRKRPLVPREVIERLARRQQVDAAHSVEDATKEQRTKVKVEARLLVSDPKGSVPDHAPEKLMANRLMQRPRNLSASSDRRIPAVDSDKIAHKKSLKRSRKFEANLLREKNQILRRNKNLGFTAGYSSANKRRFGGAPPLSGGLCNGE